MKPGELAGAPDQDLQPGVLLRGKYRVEGVIGRGGMGTVLEALHVDLDRRVAIKVLHPELRESADVVERFVREGRAASKIEGDHVARVFDVDRLDDGTPILVMELLVGRDLSFVRRDKRPLPVHEAVELVLQACTAIEVAHARGVIHRDIKPANLFITQGTDGAQKLKVLDFGISKLSSPLGASEPSVTRTTLVMGSVEFMSPEQMLSTRDVDTRTDIWALGVVLFELLTAAPPFSGDTATQICAQVMSQPPASARALRPELSEGLERVILRSLEKDRTNRYPTVAALAEALRAERAHRPQDEVGSQLPPEVTSAPSPEQRQSAPSVTSLLPEAKPTMILPSSTGSSHTAVGMASEPLPLPPKNRGVGRFIVAGVATVSLIAGATALVRSRFDSLSASSNLAPTVASQPTSTATPAGRAIARPAPSDFVEPQLSSGTPPSSGVVAPPTTASARSRQTTTPRAAASTTVPPKVTPNPHAKPSGID